MEVEKDGTLPFLDVLLTRNSYRKLVKVYIENQPTQIWKILIITHNKKCGEFWKNLTKWRKTCGVPNIFFIHQIGFKFFMNTLFGELLLKNPSINRANFFLYNWKIFTPNWWIFCQWNYTNMNMEKGSVNIERFRYYRHGNVLFRHLNICIKIQVLFLEPECSNYCQYISYTISIFQKRIIEFYFWVELSVQGSCGMCNMRIQNNRRKFIFRHFF